MNGVQKKNDFEINNERQAFLLKTIKTQEIELKKLRKLEKENSILKQQIKASNKSCFMCTFTSNHSKHGKSDFFKLAKQGRKEDQIFELFQKINYVLNDMDLSFDTVKLVKKSNNSNFKFSISKSQPTDQISLETVLFWKDKLLIADESYRLLILNLLLNLPSIHNIRIFRSHLNASFKILILNSYSYFVDIKFLMQLRIKSYINSIISSENSQPKQNSFSSIKDSSEDTIIIKLSADGTLCGHINIVNITFTIINESKLCMTSSGNYRLGMLNCQENYEELKVPFSHLASVTREIERDGVFYNNKHFKIEIKWSSDWMLEAELNGLKGPTANNPCLMCTCHKDFFDDIDLHYRKMNDPEERKTYVRSLESQKKHLESKSDKKGYKRESIMQISYDKFVKDMLHLKLNITRALVEALVEDLCKIDKYQRNHPEALNESKFPNLTKLFCFLSQKCNIKIRPGFSDLMRALRGDEINKLFQKLKEGDLIKMFPSVKNIHYIDMIWIDFWSIYQRVISNSVVHSKLAEYTYCWLKIFNSVYPKDYITSYIHYFVCHLHEQILLHGDINLYNEQGTLLN